MNHSPARSFLPATALLLSIFISGCEDNGPLKWDEEVALDNGATLWVQREAQYRAPREVGQGPAESSYSISFKHPTTGEAVRIESALRAGGEEMERSAKAKRLLMQWPITLLANGRDLFLVTRSHASYHENLLCPNPPYQLYRWSSGRWEWRPLTEIPKRRFERTFANESSFRSISRVLNANDHRLSLTDKRKAGGMDEESYDISGMTHVTYEPTRYCQTNIEWMKNKNVKN